MWEGGCHAPGRQRESRAPARRDGAVRPRQARPSRVAPRDFTSEQFRWVGTRRVGAGPSRAGPSARESRARAVGWGGTAATNAALPCGAALFHFGTVPLGRYAACRRGFFARRPVVQLPPAWSALPRSSAACARRPILLSFTSSAGEPGLAGAWTFLLSRGEKGKTT